METDLHLFTLADAVLQASPLGFALILAFSQALHFRMFRSRVEVRVSKDDYGSSVLNVFRR